MKKLYKVILEYEIEAMALGENEEDAISATKKSPYVKDDLLEITYEIAYPINDESDLPVIWQNEKPYGTPDSEEFCGTCQQIINKIKEVKVEAEKLRLKEEEFNRNQINFSFYDEMKNGEINS